MNGNRYLLDTNAVILLLQGNENLVTSCNNAEFIAVSVLSEIEFLSFRNLSENDKMLFRKFKEKVQIIDLASSNNKLINMTVNIPKESKLKLPDAIIASTAICNDLCLLTADKDFKTVKELSVDYFST